MIKAQTLKGFRDFLPDAVRKRKYLIHSLKKVVESYGFEPLETPALEYEEVLTGKYGDEGDKLMYRFEDNGGRKVAMRYDQTVPLARVVAQYTNALPMPFKRYQIQNVWRAENTQKGRYREFLQYDIDIVGSASLLSDAEIIVAAAKSFDKLCFENYKILVNDRSVFGDLPIKAIIIIDKLKKIGAEKVKEELKQKGFEDSVLEKIQNASMPGSLEKTLELAKKMGVDGNRIEFAPTLARGLDYYTGIIIEIESPDYPNGSLAGGGRYDNLIGMFANQSIPAVGLSFGFDRIIEAMDELNLFPESLLTSRVLVTVFSEELKEKSIEIANMLREKNINTEIYLNTNSKIEKQLKYADQKDIPYVIILGPEEAKKQVVILKNMNTRNQQEVSLDQLPNALI